MALGAFPSRDRTEELTVLASDGEIGGLASGGGDAGDSNRSPDGGESGGGDEGDSNSPLDGGNTDVDAREEGTPDPNRPPYDWDPGGSAAGVEGA